MLNNQTTKPCDETIENKIEEAKMEYGNFIEDKGTFLPYYEDLYEGEYVDGNLEVNGIVVDENPTKYSADNIYVRDPLGDCKIFYFQNPTLRNPIAWTSYKVHALDNTLLSAVYIVLFYGVFWSILGFVVSGFSLYTLIIFYFSIIVLPLALFKYAIFTNPVICTTIRPFPLERFLYKIKNFF